MKFSFDLHGVLNDMPEPMKFLTSSIISQGGEVHVLTGSTTKRGLEEMHELGFEIGKHFTTLIGLPDYLESRGELPTRIHPVFGNKEYLDHIWDSAKGIYCRDNNISLHFDDTLEYGKNFVTPFARLWTKDR